MLVLCELDQSHANTKSTNSKNIKMFLAFNDPMIAKARIASTKAAIESANAICMAMFSRSLKSIREAAETRGGSF